MYVAQPIAWTVRGVTMLDQRRLPAEEISYTYTDYREVAKAIREMLIRGAPAIGVAAAMGAALGVLHSAAKSVGALSAEFTEVCDTLAKTRPTAVDLFWALERMKRRFAELTGETSDIAKIKLEPKAYDIWHDRAVFHFLRTPEQRIAYVRQVVQAVKSGGHVIVSTFGPEGPTKDRKSVV